jgi:hypothetical protein
MHVPYLHFINNVLIRNKSGYGLKLSNLLLWSLELFIFFDILNIIQYIYEKHSSTLISPGVSPGQQHLFLPFSSPHPP